jgi:hypothetical protein
MELLLKVDTDVLTDHKLSQCNEGGYLSLNKLFNLVRDKVTSTQCDNCNKCDDCYRYEDGYSAGREEGYSNGTEEGREEGQADGYREGYEEGLAKGRSEAEVSGE